MEQIVKEQVDEDFQESENSSSPRSRWSMAPIQEIRNIFREEIQKNEVTVERGRERIMECEILQGIDTRRIYERVRAEWRNPVAAPATLPTEKEELSDRVHRLFREDMPSSSDIVPPTSLSSTTKALFSAELVQTLLCLCEDMIKANAPISKPKITKRLSNDIYGKQILAKLSKT